MEERETWAAELAGSERLDPLKETLTVTFIKRSYTGFRILVSADVLENRCEVLVDSKNVI
ncbi:hypothetical protein CO665_32960 [Rhizobium anhuiense]|nr:hypothetical protein CO665_32960 [Rhizobium anhuiense]